MGTNGTSGLIPPYSPFTLVNYNIPYEYVIFSNLADYYRYAENFKILQSMIEPLKLHWYNTFIPDRIELMTQVRINAQTCILEKYLNWIYGVNNIEIINSGYTPVSEFLYNDGEVGDIGTQNMFIYNEYENGTNGTSGLDTYWYNEDEFSLIYDFKVRIPQSLLNQGIPLDQIKAIINKYKTVSTIYIVEIFI